jgi:hypothetical protein
VWLAFVCVPNLPLLRHTATKKKQKEVGVYRHIARCRVVSRKPVPHERIYIKDSINQLADALMFMPWWWQRVEDSDEEDVPEPPPDDLDEKDMGEETGGESSGEDYGLKKKKGSKGGKAAGKKDKKDKDGGGWAEGARGARRGSWVGVVRSTSVMCRYSTAKKRKVEEAGSSGAPKEVGAAME